MIQTYLDSNVCFTVMGYNPMINVIHALDVVRAIQLSIQRVRLRGIFNIAGCDTAPLADFVRHFNSLPFPVPEPMFPVINFLQRKTFGTDFDYSVNPKRLKFSLLLNADRARDELGFEPRISVLKQVQKLDWTYRKDR
jgi:nucleoside-diphosphate-sugar epimerase